MFEIRKFLRCAAEACINYIVAYIPSWWIRKGCYRLLGMKIGKGSRINQRVYIFSPWKISIGKNTMINSFSLLDGRGGLVIGDNVSVSMRAVIYSASHKSYSNTFEYYEKTTTIGNCAWICVNSVLLPGTQIADRCIVSANSVLKGKTEVGGVYAGIPACFVRTRELDTDYQLDNTYYFL